MIQRPDAEAERANLKDLRAAHWRRLGITRTANGEPVMLSGDLEQPRA